MITCYIYRIIFKTTNVRDSFAQNFVTLIDCLDCAELGIDKICIKHYWNCMRCSYKSHRLWHGDYRV